ncbi:MAG TPA: nitroreductase family protein [Acidobacteriota bacterium]
MLQKIAFSQPVADLVRRRYSCRSFDGRGVESGLLEAMEKFPAGLDLPFRSRLRFGVIDNKKVRSENLFSAGSYGMIRGARFYLAALVRKDEPRRWEDAGFALEAAVLQATSLGLGSCWIGGVFDRKRFGRALGIGAGEQLPAVVAIGRPAARPSLRDRLVRWSAGGNLRKSPAELFFAGDWRTPLPYEEAAAWGPVLECVRLAPSASNKQPWRVIRQSGVFHFFLSRDKAYGAMMPLADLQRIDLGIAICHFQSAAADAGMRGEWLDEDPNLPETPVNYEYILSFVIH